MGPAQVAALVAVGAAALSLVATLGAYLYVRFTQHRRGGPGEPAPRAGGPPAPKDAAGP
ncbi:MAG TPA: hypothetical protein VI078_02070 [bacterium]